jgi:hypothetical protein
MKTYITSIVILLVLISSTNLNSQNCQGYFPAKKGAVMETTMYNDKGKKEGTSTITINDIKSEGGKTTYSIHSEMKDEKEKPTANADYEAYCSGSTFYISMKSMVPSEQMAAWKDMEVSMKADDIEYPADAKAGDMLKDAHLEVNTSMSGMKMPAFLIDITERKVVGTESVTTPAGMFDCIKVTSVQKIKNIVSYEMHSIEWLSKGVGVVKTESYKGDKRKSYTELTAVK